MTRRKSQRYWLSALGMVFLQVGATCNTPVPNDPGPAEPVWRSAFDTTGAGFLSAVWGSSPSDVFIVGGQADQAEVYHYDGQVWSAMNVPAIPVLVWVFGFGADDVFAVGEGGGVVHYDGASWTEMDSGTDVDLWGVWGNSPTDVWAVGGNIPDGPPIILHYDGMAWSSVDVPTLDRASSALLKVWGTSANNVFAVGQLGVIVKYDGNSWEQEPSGTGEDLISLWGSGPNNIIAVGGRSNGVVARYSEAGWSSQSIAPFVGLNGVFMEPSGEAVAVGLLGSGGLVDPGGFGVTNETTGTSQTLHGVWGDGAGRYYAVGGRSDNIFSGVALVRSTDVNGDDPMVPNSPSGNLQLEIGVANGSPYAPLEANGDMPVFSGGQGGFHIFPSFHLTGFPPDATLNLTSRGMMVDGGATVVQEFTFSAQFEDIGGGVNELIDWFTPIILLRSEVVGEQAVLAFEVWDVNDPSVRASAEQTVTFTLGN